MDLIANRFFFVFACRAFFVVETKIGMYSVQCTATMYLKESYSERAGHQMAEPWQISG